MVNFVIVGFCRFLFLLEEWTEWVAAIKRSCLEALIRTDLSLVGLQLLFVDGQWLCI